MQYTRTTSPDLNRITLAEAKSQLNVLTTSQDDYINSLIDVAEGVIMSRTNTAFQSTSYEGQTFDFSGEVLRIPVAPVTAITFLKVKETVDDADYTTLEEGTDFVLGKSEIRFPSHKTYYEISVGFVSGYTNITFPLGLKGATLMMIGTLYANRQSEMGNVVEKIPYGIEFMLNPYVHWYFE